MAEKLMLVDGHSILNRAFYGVPDLTNAQGTHTNAMYGFINILSKFLNEEKPDYLTVAFDLSAPTFRHEVYKEYKGTRSAMPVELKEQVPLMKELLHAMNIKTVELAGFEADDLLGTIAKRYAHQGLDVRVISGDRDLLQLAEENLMIRIPKTKKGVTEVENYLPADVEALYGVTPLEFIEMKALMGDSSDNIPGAPGVGPKTASKLIQEYKSVENILAHLDELKPPKAQKSISEHAEQVKLSLFLARINTEVPIEYDLEDARLGNFFNDNSYELFKRYNFKSMLANFEEVPEGQEEDILSAMTRVQDFSEAENAFEKAGKLVSEGKKIGFGILSDDVCHGISLCLGEENLYIEATGFITSEYLMGKFADLAREAQDNTIHVIGFKSKLHLFTKEQYEGLHQEAFYDTALAAYLLNPSMDEYTADSLATAFLHKTLPSRTELLGKNVDLSMADEDKCMMVCGIESFTALHAGLKTAEELKLEEMDDLFHNVEMPLSFVLFEMEREGIQVQASRLKEYSDKLSVQIEALEKKIYEQAGEEFNINSPKQLAVILFEKMQLPGGKKTKSGYSTAAAVLEKLAGEYPIVGEILEYRTLTKLKSTYADGLQNYIANDGRIHGHFNQTITATGRISSTDPNLQNIPVRIALGREIRKVFVPKEGCIFLDADYSQIELRIMAHMSGDEKLIEAYRTSKDIHRITASQVFHVPFEEVTPEQRRNAKAVNFGIIYGISSFGLSQDLSISKKEAAEYIEKYFETFPKVKSYIDGLVEQAKKNGYSLTMFNRRRLIPELKSSNFMQRSFGERVAMNAPIQGTAADIIKIAMIRVNHMLKERGLKSKLLLQIHDELLVETVESEAEQVKAIMEDAMMNAVSLAVPLEIDLKPGKSWFEAH